MTHHTATLGTRKTAVPFSDSVGTYGALSLLAAHCPLHSSFSARLLNRLFLPAVEHEAVRIFRTSDNKPCGALIWARLSDEVALRMFTENQPPRANDWNSGDHLWFLDLLAPFGHGKDIARHLVRNPPKEAFSFARLGPDKKLRKLIEVQRESDAGRSFRSFFAEQDRPV